ncbi:MAG: S26 family signal peptidase [Neisseriaceae bacterium]
MLGKIRRINKRYFKLINVIILWSFCCVVSSSVYKNVTTSEPLGYYLGYKAFTYDVGDLVLLCIEDSKYINVMHKLGAIRTDGECKNGTAYLLKRIIAKSGDIVTITENGIIVNNIHYLHSKGLLSYNGIQLFPQKKRQIKLKGREYFVLGDGNTSFDSRYFGVINVNQIAKKAVLIIKQ